MYAPARCSVNDNEARDEKPDEAPWDPVGSNWAGIEWSEWRESPFLECYGLGHSQLYNLAAGRLYKTIYWILVALVPLVMVVSIIFAFRSEHAGLSHYAWLEAFGVTATFLLTPPVVKLNAYGTVGSLFVVVLALGFGVSAFYIEGPLAHMLLEISASLFALVVLEHMFRGIYRHVVSKGREAQSRAAHAEDRGAELAEQISPKTPRGL